MTFLNTARGSFEAFRSELRRNQRLRRLIYLVGLLFLFYLVLVADDARVAVNSELESTISRLSRLEALSMEGAPDFGEIYAAERDIHERLREQVWLATTPGLASADFQSWLRRVTTEIGLDKVRLELSDVRPVEGMIQPLWRLEAEITTSGAPAQVREFLTRVASYEKRLSVEQFSYLPERGERLRCVLVAYFLVGEGVTR